MYLDDARTELGVFHAAHAVRQEQHLAVADIGDEARLAVEEARIAHFLLVADAPVLEILLPRRAERRIHHAEVELLARVTVLRDGGAAGDELMFGRAKAVGELLDVTGNHQVCLAGRVGVVLQFLSEDQRLDLLARFPGNLVELFLRHRENAARAARAVVDRVSAVLERILDRLDRQPRQKPHIVPRRKVLTGLGDVVLFIEAPQKFLEHRPHRMVVEPGEDNKAVVVLDRLDGKVDRRIGELLENRPETPLVRQRIHPMPQLELVDHVLHVGRETVEILQHVHLQPLRIDLVLQRRHRERRSVVKRIARHLRQERLVGQLVLVAESLFRRDLRLGRFEQHVDAAQHGERQDDLLVIPFFKGVHEHVVGDVPNETKKLSVLLIVHFWEKKSERIGEPFTLAGTRMISREKLPRQPSVQT